MKKRFLAIIALSCMFIVSANIDSNAILEQSNFSIVVDEDVPIVNIISPLNTSYSNDTSLLINVSVFDHSLDSVWYSINSGPDVVYSQPVFIDLPEGGYFLEVFANDSLARIGSDSVFFSIDNSIPAFCGDFSCNGGETCGSCLSDCGSCPSPDAGGGGGGGGGAPSREQGNDMENSFLIDVERIDEKIFFGERKDIEITLDNLLLEKQNILISFSDDFSRVLDIGPSVELSPNEQRSIRVSIFGSADPGTYFGTVAFAGKTLQEIPFAITIFRNKRISVGVVQDDFIVRTNVDVGGIFGETEIEYFIYNENGLLELHEVDFINILEERISKEFESISPGRYFMKVRISDGQEVFEDGTFFVVDSIIFPQGNRFFWSLFLILVIALVFVIIFIFFLNRKRKKRD